MVFLEALLGRLLGSQGTRGEERRRQESGQPAHLEAFLFGGVYVGKEKRITKSGSKMNVVHQRPIAVEGSSSSMVLAGETAWSSTIDW